MHDDHLQQASELARIDATGRPKQANLRRAISAAYYALFHYLVDQSCRNSIGTRHIQAPCRQVVGRAFEHKSIKDACRSFAGGTLKASVSKGLPPSFAIPQPIRDVATTFCELQDKRHEADYDMTERFQRSDVLGLVDQAERAIDRFRQLPNSNERKFFLACLWAWKALASR